MIHHTMIVSFNSPIPESELDQYLADLEQLVKGVEQVKTFSARRHLSVPGDAHAPVCVASAVTQFGFDDLDQLEAVFAVPGLEELIGRWQARHPYKVVWVNHEPLD